MSDLWQRYLEGGMKTAPFAALGAGGLVWFLCYQALGPVGAFFGWIPGVVAGSIMAMLWTVGWLPLLVGGFVALILIFPNGPAPH